MSFVSSVCAKTTASPKPPQSRLALERRLAPIVGWVLAIAAGVILWAGLALLFGSRDGRMVTLASDCAATSYRDPVTGRVQTTKSSASALEKRLVCGTD